MSYIGRGTENISNVEVLDNLTFDGSASYTLQKSSTNFVPSSANNLLISISGVVQQGNFSVSGSTITFDTTVSASDTCDWILHYGTGLITTVADGAITEAKLGSNAVTTAKINDSAVTYAKTDGNFGKIGQVLQSVDTGVFLTTSSSFTDTNLTINITPSSTSSKILVSYEIVHGASIATNIFYKLLRDSTAIGIGTNGSYSVLCTTAATINDSRGEGTSMSFLDSPSTTSQITYKVQAHANGNNLYINRRANTDFNCISTLTVMEVLA